MSTETAYSAIGDVTEFRRGQLNAARNTVLSPIAQSHVVYEGDTQGNATNVTQNAQSSIQLSYDATNRVTGNNGSSNAAGNTASLGDPVRREDRRRWQRLGRDA